MALPSPKTIFLFQFAIFLAATILALFFSAFSSEASARPCEVDELDHEWISFYDTRPQCDLELKRSNRYALNGLGVDAMCDDIADVDDADGSRYGYSSAIELRKSSGGLCRSSLTLGTSNLSDGIGLISAMGASYAQQLLDKWNLGTANELALRRACARGAGMFGAALAGWYGGVFFGCRASCGIDSCGYDGF
jgi:hypothetical protein